ncbi:MAG: PQQ-binding-like beta-propeller repeat protein, partial [Victivallales bacterium]|nr:PQQ-binding-like beta-propeller repeat protein [Victivallales bacterium]
ALDVHTGKEVWVSKRETSSSWSSPVALINGTKATIFTAGNIAAEGIDANTGQVLWKNESLGGEVATSALVANNAFYFSNSGAFTGAFSPSDGKILFKNEDTPAPDVASPIVVNDTFLLFSSGGSVVGISAKDGKELYEKEFDNGFYASPVVLDHKIVGVNLDGDLFRMSASPTGLKIEAKYAIGKRVVATPAFHRGNIIIRTSDDELIYLESK